MTSNIELLESLKSILTTAHKYPYRATDCLSAVISKGNARVSSSCSGIACEDCIFQADNYEQTLALIQDTTNIIKLRELVE